MSEKQGHLTQTEFVAICQLPDTYTTAGCRSQPSIAYIKALYAQAAHETGDFTSNIFQNGKNLFGMKNSTKRRRFWLDKQNGHATYANIQKSIIDRLDWDVWHRITFSNLEDYMSRVKALGYAADPLYIKKWRKMYETIEGELVNPPDPEKKKQTIVDKFVMIAFMALVGIFIWKR